MASNSSEEIPSTAADVDCSAADNLLASGKRHMICCEIEEALKSFSEACEIYSEKYGETGEQLAEPYLNYGKALLQMARIENGVLGGAMKEAAGEKDVPDDIEVESCQTDKTDISSAIPPEERKEEESEGASCSHEHVTDGEVSHTAEDLTVPVGGGDGDGSSCDGDEAEEDITNMQLAWQILELAGNIYESMGDNGRIQLAETKHELGQVSMEEEDYELAIADFTEAYEIQKEALEADDRRIAETCYDIGLAHSFDKKYIDSIAWYERAVEVLQLRVEKLDKMIAGAEAEGGKEKAGSEGWIVERNEISGLVMQDMKLKIEDAKASQKQYDLSVKAMREMAKGVFGEVASVFDSGFGSSGFDAPLEGASNGFGSSSNGFGDSSNGFDPTLNAQTATTNSLDDCMVIKKVPKRKMEEDDRVESDTKKLKGIENGTLIVQAPES